MDDELRHQIQLAQEYFGAEEYDKAEPIIVAVLKKNDRLADLHNMLGVIHHHRDQVTHAAVAFEAALQINPAYTEAALNLAVTYNELGRYADARQVYNRAISVSKAQPRQIDPFAKGKLANMHSRTANAYATLGLHHDAVREYRKALELCPQFVDIRCQLGSTLRELGDHELAIAEYGRVVDMAPQFVPARVQRGLTYYSLGKRPEARADWEAALQLDPNNKSCRLYLDILSGK